MLKHLVADEEEFTVWAKALDVDDLNRNTLYSTLPQFFRTRGVLAKVPTSVDQHGINYQRVSPKDAANLREQLGNED